MTFDLKPLSAAAVPRALVKADRYRLLSEPGEAESICLDALGVDPDNQEALEMLLLALTDQFDDDATVAVPEAWKCAERMHHLGAARQGAAQARDAGLRSAGLPLASRGDDLVRAGRSDPAARQRRCPPAVERVRAAHHA
jgi:hypothetical protein